MHLIIRLISYGLVLVLSSTLYSMDKNTLTLHAMDILIELSLQCVKEKKEESTSMTIRDAKKAANYIRSMIKYHVMHRLRADYFGSDVKIDVNGNKCMSYSIKYFDDSDHSSIIFVLEKFEKDYSRQVYNHFSKTITPFWQTNIMSPDFISKILSLGRTSSRKTAKKLFIFNALYGEISTLHGHITKSIKELTDKLRNDLNPRFVSSSLNSLSSYEDIQNYYQVSDELESIRIFMQFILKPFKDKIKTISPLLTIKDVKALSKIEKTITLYEKWQKQYEELSQEVLQELYAIGANDLRELENSINQEKKRRYRTKKETKKRDNNTSTYCADKSDPDSVNARITSEVAQEQSMSRSVFLTLLSKKYGNSITVVDDDYVRCVNGCGDICLFYNMSDHNLEYLMEEFERNNQTFKKVLYHERITKRDFATVEQKTRHSFPPCIVEVFAPWGNKGIYLDAQGNEIDCLYFFGKCFPKGKRDYFFATFVTGFTPEGVIFHQYMNKYRKDDMFSMIQKNNLRRKSISDDTGMKRLIQSEFRGIA